MLKYTQGQPWVRLRELCGADELLVADTSTRSALQLLDRLLNQQSLNDPSIGTAGSIVTADRDELLATIYKNPYGAKIESTVRCQFCSEKFDIGFSLHDLQAYLQPHLVEEGIEYLADGTYKLDSGCHFRLPVGEDELAVAVYPVQDAGTQLLKRCILDGDAADFGEKIQTAMEKIAPVLQTEIVGHCPECGKEQQMQFDIQSFLLTRLKNERKQTAWEIHCLASTYRWSHEEILNLPRSLRKMYVSYIRSERVQ